MNEYHKIQTVWLRDPETKHRTLIEDAWAKPEFDYLKDVEWVFEEKIDGTNMRLDLVNADKFVVGGRTANAQIPAFLMDRMQEIGVRASGLGFSGMTLYGEGYGNKIQKVGSKYIPDGVDFVLFDVFCRDIWLERHNVAEIADTLDIGHAPVEGMGKLRDAIDIARMGFNSWWGDFPAEGLIMRPKTELLNRRGHRIITKIKSKDFQ